MACMCVPPSWLVATPWLVPILLRSLVKVRGSSPQRGSSPLLIVPTLEGWKAEYTLASRMQIHESLTVLALLTRGEARTSDPWICSLMLYHLSYLANSVNYFSLTIQQRSFQILQANKMFEFEHHLSRRLAWRFGNPTLIR